MVVELAKDELNNFAKVWALAILALSYCYTIGKLTSKGFARLIVILPVIALFLTLPLKLTSLHLCGFTSFFITWLANFKLFLFAFGKPPLCSHFGTPISFPRFLALASLPVEIQNSENKSHPHAKVLQKSKIDQYPYHKTPKILDTSSQKSPWGFNLIIKGATLLLILKLYQYSNEIPPKILWVIHFINIYLILEIILALLANSTKYLLGLELEPQFMEPILSSSLQDFWGKRWNLMVSSILKPTIFHPIRNSSTQVLSPDLARLVAVMGTFMVSALMHELIFFYLARVRPTFEVTWFFIIHGFCLCLEIYSKKYLIGKSGIPRWISDIATKIVLVGLTYWLLMPVLIRAELDNKALQEYTLIGTFVGRAIGAIPQIK